MCGVGTFFCTALACCEFSIGNEASDGSIVPCAAIFLDVSVLLLLFWYDLVEIGDGDG